MDPVEPLGAVEVLLLLVPAAVAVGVGVALRLGQARRIGVATARALVQLLAIGWVIGWVFAQRTWPWILLLLVVMTLVAATTAASQVGRFRWKTAGFLSVILGGVTGLALVYMTWGVIGVHGAEPRYWIPLGGMLLGNAMTAAALAMERVGSEIARSGGDVEVLLSMGASPSQAMRPAMRRAVAAALTPTINAMLIVGIVKLPGMMTGQMLGGTEPSQAALYQFLILMGLVFGDTLAATASCFLLQRRVFTPAWQLDPAAVRAFRREGA